MPENEVTLGELSRSIKALEGRIDGQFQRVNSRLDNLEYVPRREFEIQIATLVDDVKELRDSRQWIQRTLVASFLFPVLVAVIVALVVTR